MYTLTNWADTTHPDHGLLRAGVELSHREAEAFHGHPDFSEPFEGIFAEACRGEYYDRDFVVLRDDAPDGEVRGFLQVLYPLSDNTHLGFVWSEAQGRDTDLTVALLAEAERLAAARGAHRSWSGLTTGKRLTASRFLTLQRALVVLTPQIR